MNITALQANLFGRTDGNYNNRTLLVEVMFSVFRIFLLKRAPSLVLTLSCRRKSTCNFYRDILDEMFRLWDDPDKLVQIVVIDSERRAVVGGARHRNLLLVDSYQTFLDANIISFTNEHNFNEYNYIFLRMPHDKMKPHLKQILEYCWTHYIIRCSVQVQNEQGEILVYSYYPYTAENCGEVVPVEVNRYNGNFFVNRKLFPNKLTNLHGCPLRAAVFNVPPFLLLTSKDNETVISGGFEGKLIQEIAALLNFTIEVKIPPNNEERGNIEGNTTTGALKMLVDRTADLSLGGFRQSVERDQVVSYTMNHFQSKEVFVALNSAYDLTSWQILVYPFQTSAWLLIFFALMLAALRAYLAKRLFLQSSTYFHHYDPKNCYIDLFSTLIGMSAINMPWTTRGRILLVNWLYFTLIIRTLYQALIFNQITTRVENELPRTFDELLESNFTAVMIESTAESTQNMVFLEKMQKVILNTTNKFEPFSYLEQKKSRKFLAVTPKEYLLLYAKDYKKPGVFKIVPQHLFTFSTTIYLTKHSHLIEQFNEEIMWLNVAGLVEFWSRDMDHRYYKRVNLGIDNIYGMDKLYMVFVVYAIGMVMACLVYLLEILSLRYGFLRRIFGTS